MAKHIPQEERNTLALEAGKVFSPAAPINEQELFTGRNEQIRIVVDAINQRGQHAVVYGERGVGKTSLANILASRLHAAEGQLISPHVNCDSGDDYSSIWRKVFSEIELTKRIDGIGQKRGASSEANPITATLPRVLTSGDVRSSLRLLAPSANYIVIIIDEFDRVASTESRAMFADTVKMLSDHSVNATMVLVGVADTVTDLISEHESVERALVQVHMPRMLDSEISLIVKNGIDRLGLSITGGSLAKIAFLARGLPHYAHLLGRYAVRRAIDEGQGLVQMRHIEAAIEEALNQVQQSTRRAYHTATTSQRKGGLYSDVLLACALAQTDSLGYFAAADVRAPLRDITKKATYDIPNFSKHLNDFSEPERGSILQKTGVTHRPRYRFANSLMQPFVIMQGYNDQRLKFDVEGNDEEA